MAASEQEKRWQDRYNGMAGAISIVRSHVGLPPLDLSAVCAGGLPTPNGEAREICRAIDAMKVTS